MRNFEPHELFNCCTDYKAPDWSKFDALELGGCIEGKDEDTGETWTEGCVERQKAQFFTVYGHIPGEGVEAITDSKTFVECVRVANELSRLSGGLPVSVVC